MSRPLRLNLGAGDKPIKGFRNIDRASGGEVYPLAVKPGSVDEIRASHVLEHFSYRQTAEVLAHWVQALKPGGLLKIAVPDFEACARQYLAGEDVPIQGLVMGGHADQNDRHGAIFDQEELHEAMRAAGLYGVTRWASEHRDCAALPWSLNLQGYKPPARWPRISGVMSTPRLGFMDNMFCPFEALRSTDVKLRRHTGAYWEQCITRAIEEALELEDPEWILTIDYDSIYTREHVEALVFAAMRHPEADAIAPIQAHRSKPLPLMTISDGEGNNVANVPWEFFQTELGRVRTAHFGLTLIKVSALLEVEKPWFHSRPDAAGEWHADRIDADIAFWVNWERAGKTLYLANRVAIGHGEFMIRWPGRDMHAIYQHPNEFQVSGRPDGAWR